MSKRIGLTIPDEFYGWLSSRAEDTGLPVAAYSLMVLNQHKKQLENQSDLSAMLNFVSQLPPEIIQAELKKVNSKLQEEKEENEID